MKKLIWTFICMMFCGSILVSVIVLLGSLVTPSETPSERITRICSDNYSVPSDVQDCRAREMLRVILARQSASENAVDSQVGN